MDKSVGADHQDVPWMRTDVMPAPNQQLVRYIGSSSSRLAVPEDRRELVHASELPPGSDFP